MFKNQFVLKNSYILLKTLLFTNILSVFMEEYVNLYFFE